MKRTSALMKPPRILTPKSILGAESEDDRSLSMYERAYLGIRSALRSPAISPVAAIESLTAKSRRPSSDLRVQAGTLKLTRAVTLPRVRYRRLPRTRREEEINSVQVLLDGDRSIESCAQVGVELGVDGECRTEVEDAGDVEARDTDAEDSERLGDGSLFFALG